MPVDFQARNAYTGEVRTLTLPAMYRSLEWWERRAVREKYVEVQRGMCHHCKGALAVDPPLEILSKQILWSAFPEKFLAHPIHLHHSRETGLTIGAVHAYCNAVFWQYHGE